MSNKQTNQIARAVANLDADDQMKVLRASDDEFLKNFGQNVISLVVCGRIYHSFVNLTRQK